MISIKAKLKELGFSHQEINGDEWEEPPLWILENIPAEKIRESIIHNQFLYHESNDANNRFKFLKYISDCCWNCERTIEDKVAMNFRLFEFFPDYLNFLLPIYRLFSHQKIDNIDLKKIILQKLLTYLLGESIYEKSVIYILQMEFFDDMITVEESWKGLVDNAFSDTHALLKLITIGLQVPFNMKTSVYEKLIPSVDSHSIIFECIDKQFDNRKKYQEPDYCFAKKDYPKAISILERLTITPYHKEKYEELYYKLIR